MAALAAIAVASPAARADDRRAEPMRDVIVTMRSQASPRSMPRAELERVLRRTADRGQREVLAVLRRGRAAGQVRVVQRFWVFDGLRVVAGRALLRQIARLPSVATVRANRDRGSARATAASAVPASPPAQGVALIGAPKLWEQGVTGAGVVIASLDGGVDAGHPDLATSFRGGSNSWFDATGEHPRRPFDASGHGTATMGVMVGSGAGGTTLGVAPAARWIAARVFDDRGRSKPSWIHAAFQWLLDPDGRPGTNDGPQVVNASWNRAGGGCDREFSDDLRNLRAAGILPVFASGNDMHDASPANDPSAFAVGSVDGAGALGAGSGRGPSACARSVYPKLVAPGVGIETTDLFGLYGTQTGTSVAAPHVSGALALLLSRFPGTSAQRQEAALEATAVDLGTRGPDDVFGYGRLDVAAAATWLERTRDFTVTPSPWSAAAVAGSAAELRVTVAPVNGFAGPVRLSVAGVPGQARAFFSRARLPAGRGRSRLTVHTGKGLRAGTYPLTVRATSGGVVRAVTVSLIVRPRAVR